MNGKHTIEGRLRLATETLLDTADDLIRLVPGCELHGLRHAAGLLRVYAAYMRSQANINVKMLTGHTLGEDGHLPVTDPALSMSMFANSSDYKAAITAPLQVRVDGISEGGFRHVLEVEGATQLRDGVLGVVVHLPKQIGEMKCWLNDCKTVEQCADSGCAQRLATQPQAPQGAVTVERVANDIAAWAMDGSRPDEWKLREWETQLRASVAKQGCEWRPIDTATEKDGLVLVYTPPQDGDWPDTVRINFDYICPDYEDWHDHCESREHYLAVGGANACGPDVVCTGPGEKAPYTHWMPLPAAPETPEVKS